MARRPYPTINGIAVPIFELDLPDKYSEEKNNHHNEWPGRTMGQVAIHDILRSLGRHQYLISTKLHSSIHEIYDPPELPTRRQAAREIICAYERGEYRKIYDPVALEYYFIPISPDIVDAFVREYRIFGPQPDRTGSLLEMAEKATADISFHERTYHVQAFGDTEPYYPRNLSDNEFTQ